MRLLALCFLASLLPSASAIADGLAGNYGIVVSCALGKGTGKLQIVEHGKNSYVITGSSRGGTYSGSIRGGSFQMHFSGSGNEADFTASSLADGNLQGSLTQRASFGGPCTWVATRTGTIPKSDGKPLAKESEREKEIAEAKASEARGRAVAKRSDCESQKSAARDFARASGNYRRFGFIEESNRLNTMADKLTGEGGTYDKCVARLKAKTIRKSPPNSKNQTDKNKPRTIGLRTCLQVESQIMKLEARANDMSKKEEAETLKIVEKLKVEMKKAGC